MPQWGTSDEYPQHTFVWRTGENYPIVITEYSSLTSLCVYGFADSKKVIILAIFCHILWVFLWVLTGIASRTHKIHFVAKKSQKYSLKTPFIWTRARENRKNSRSGPKLRILDRFQTPQNANKSVQQVCALNPIFPKPTNFHESMMSKKITNSQVFPNWQRPRTF